MLSNAYETWIAYLKIRIGEWSSIAKQQFKKISKLAKNKPF